MKKLMLVVLCLCLVSCGTFDVKLQILPTATAAPTVTVVSPKGTATTQPTAAMTPIVARSTPTEVNPTIALTNLQMSDASQGWAVTSSGRIVRTSNGGAIWHDITPLPGNI